MFCLCSYAVIVGAFKYSYACMYSKFQNCPTCTCTLKARTCMLTLCCDVSVSATSQLPIVSDICYFARMQGSCKHIEASDRMSSTEQLPFWQMVYSIHGIRIGPTLKSRITCAHCRQQRHTREAPNLHLCHPRSFATKIAVVD